MNEALKIILFYIIDHQFIICRNRFIYVLIFFKFFNLKF